MAGLLKFRGLAVKMAPAPKHLLTKPPCWKWKPLGEPAGDALKPGRLFRSDLSGNRLPPFKLRGVIRAINLVQDPKGFTPSPARPLAGVPELRNRVWRVSVGSGRLIERMLVNKRFGGEMKRRLGVKNAHASASQNASAGGVRRHQKEHIWQKSQHVANGQLIFNRPSRGGGIKGLPWRQSKY